MAGDDQLSYNTRMALTENWGKTSNQIGLAYSPAMTTMYEKKPYPALPIVRMSKSYKPGKIYTPGEGYKSTYDATYSMPIADENVNTLPSKLLSQPREYSKLGKLVKPQTAAVTEYIDEYPPKQAPLPKKGVSVEQEMTCPMVMTGRDERDPLPLTQNYNKYLDIYLSTSRLAHRPFTLQEQKSIAMKDIVTSQETMELPKGRGFGCKFPAFPGQDLDNRDPNMVDKLKFPVEAKLRYIPSGMPKVPHFGSESEMKASYVKPEGAAVPRLFTKLADYPQTIVGPTAKQTMSPPGMYSTESSAIHQHTSPQTVV